MGVVGVDNVENSKAGVNATTRSLWCGGLDQSNARSDVDLGGRTHVLDLTVMQGGPLAGEKSPGLLRPSRCSRGQAREEGHTSTPCSCCGVGTDSTFPVPLALCSH